MQKLLLLLVGVTCAMSADCASSRATQAVTQDPSHFTYARIYCTPDRKTHFQDVTVTLTKVNFAPPAAPVYIGGKVATSNVFIGGAEAHWGASDLENHRNHPAPAVQFVVFLRGASSITTTDGETRRFGPGDVVRVEDTSPCEGHITVNIGDTPGFVLFAP